MTRSEAFDRPVRQWLCVVTVVLGAAVLPGAVLAAPLELSVRFVYDDAGLPVAFVPLRLYATDRFDPALSGAEHDAEELECGGCGTDADGYFERTLEVSSRYVLIDLVYTSPLVIVADRAIEVPASGATVNRELRILRTTASVGPEFGAEVLERVRSVAELRGETPAQTMSVFWEGLGERAYPTVARAAIVQAMVADGVDASDWEDVLAQESVEPYSFVDVDQVREFTWRFSDFAAAKSGFRNADPTSGGNDADDTVLTMFEAGMSYSELNASVVADTVWQEAISQPSAEEAAAVVGLAFDYERVVGSEAQVDAAMAASWYEAVEQLSDDERVETLFEFVRGNVSPSALPNGSWVYQPNVGLCEQSNGVAEHAGFEVGPCSPESASLLDDLRLRDDAG